MSQITSSIIETKRRGRKSVVSLPNTDKKVVLKQHHFDYSDEFAKQLSIFAKAHLEENSKTFKSSWSLWMEENYDQIQKEITRMKNAGYEGNVEDKMYFSVRYYYRKKAIQQKDSQEQEGTPEQEKKEEDKTPRKKYESTDKIILKQMNNHILSNIYPNEMGVNQDQACKIIVSNMLPSNAYIDYCNIYGISTEDARTKKTYKNLYWRITKKISMSTKR